MDHVAIDLGGRESQICIRRLLGRRLFDGCWSHLGDGHRRVTSGGYNTIAIAA